MRLSGTFVNQGVRCKWHDANQYVRFGLDSLPTHPHTNARTSLKVFLRSDCMTVWFSVDLTLRIGPLRIRRWIVLDEP